MEASRQAEISHLGDHTCANLFTRCVANAFGVAHKECGPLCKYATPGVQGGAAAHTGGCGKACFEAATNRLALDIRLGKKQCLHTMMFRVAKSRCTNKREERKPIPLHISSASLFFIAMLRVVVSATLLERLAVGAPAFWSWPGTPNINKEGVALLYYRCNTCVCTQHLERGVLGYKIHLISQFWRHFEKGAQCYNW